ncbi:hypothetical protein [Stutzerimonas stutzeri]|uniref:hypothetical protein n=2 Tax=Stutzerimonas stutzeri TaxID=316 RepID=UPI0032B40385
MASGELFSSGEMIAPPGRGHEVKWYLVTNHQNLMFMLSAGMVMPPSGFGKKYYQDTLSLIPGWVPLFPESIWRSALDHSVAEQPLLRPCCAELDLSGVSGGVKVLRSGGWEDVRFPEEVYGNEELVLVPAPLPVSMVKEICFASKEDKAYCEKDAKYFSNVPLVDFKTKVAAGLFKKTKNTAWPPRLDGVAERPVELHLADAFGGVLTLLSLLSGRDDMAAQLTRAFFQPELDAEVSTSVPMLIGAHALFYSPARLAEQYGASGALYRDLAKALVQCRSDSGTGSPKDIVMRELEAFNATWQGVARDGIERLIDDLKRIVQFPDKTLDELLEIHQKPLPRTLVLFFLNDNSQDLLEINSSQLSGYEVCGAAILFGITEGWMRMSTQQRVRDGLNAVVPAHMAYLSHQISGSGFDLGVLPERRLSLRELFGEKHPDSKTSNAALGIARACKWDCIKTRIKLGKGAYQLLIDGAGASLLLDGDIKAVEAEIDWEKFRAYLGAGPDLPSKVELEARKMLGN